MINETALRAWHSAVCGKNKALDGLEKPERDTRTKPIYDEWYGILFEIKEKYGEQERIEHLQRPKAGKSHYLDKDRNFDFNKLNRDRDKMSGNGTVQEA